MTIADLSYMSVDCLEDDIDTWRRTGLELEGFTYRGFAGYATWDVTRRLEWVSCSRPFYVQPYEQLSNVYRDAGRGSDATRVGIAKERACNKVLGGRTWIGRVVRRFAHGLWGWTTRYGYRPAHALYWFVGLLAVAALFYGWSSDSGVIVPTDPTSTAVAGICIPDDPYPCFQPLLYAFDVMVPIVDLDQRDAWTAHPAIGGEGARIATVAAIMLGWTLTAAFIAAVGQTMSRR